MKRLSATSALLVMLGLTSALWTLVAVELNMSVVDTMTIGIAAAFTAMMVAWPFVNGMRVGAQGVTHVAVCRHCGLELGPLSAFGFCMHCGTMSTPAAPRPAQRRPTA